MNKIRNYYFLIVGILSVLFSVSHGWFGETSVLPLIETSNLDISSRTAVFYTWHMSTAENFIFGIVFFIMAFYKDATKLKFTVWMIISIVVIRYAVFFVSTWIKNRSGINEAIPELVILIIYVVLMILGISKRKLKTVS
jgi:hypothetical protein